MKSDHESRDVAHYQRQGTGPFLLGEICIRLLTECANARDIWKEIFYGGSATTRNCKEGGLVGKGCVHSQQRPK